MRRLLSSAVATLLLLTAFALPASGQFQDADHEWVMDRAVQQDGAWVFPSHRGGDVALVPTPVNGGSGWQVRALPPTSPVGGTGHAFRFPPTRSLDNRAEACVEARLGCTGYLLTSVGDEDELDPGDRVLRLRVDVRTSLADLERTPDDFNVLQKGSFATSQYKVTIDPAGVKCVVQEEADGDRVVSVVPRDEVPWLFEGEWARIECYVRNDGVTTVVRSRDGRNRVAWDNTRVAPQALGDGVLGTLANDLPLTVGGLLTSNADGVPYVNDQFVGDIDNIVIRFAEEQPVHQPA